MIKGGCNRKLIQQQIYLTDINLSKTNSNKKILYYYNNKLITQVDKLNLYYQNKSYKRYNNRIMIYDNMFYLQVKCLNL